MSASPEKPAREPAGVVGAPNTSMPRHVAIIMDGNGRWAARRGLPRFEGHRRGMEALRNVVRIAGDLGISYLTVYGFSSENWSRPAAEIADLMGLLRHFVRRDLADLHRSNVRVRIIGTDEGLAPDLVGLLAEAENLTRNNTALTLVVAFNYGARQEITQAARRLASDVAAGRLAADDISVERFSETLNTADIPDPDLLIRTSGEQRLSNFLLWQAAYAELVFTPVLWPDFDRGSFEEALSEYQRRERRFGGLSSAAG